MTEAKTPKRDIEKYDHSDPKRWICIYPAFIDKTKKREEGRKIPKSKAVEKPTATEIYDVLEAADLNVILETGKMYSRDQNREPGSQGRVKVQLKDDDGKPFNTDFLSRRQILLDVAEMIPKLKTRQPGYVPPPATSAKASAAGGKKNKKKKK